MKKKLPIIGVILISFVLMSGIVDLNNLFDYEGQEKPTYVASDNTPGDNEMSDEGATLGRVLFYDKNLSVDNTIACASCHLQEYAFGDTAVVSKGVNGVTGRHSMRLSNARFSNEVRAFWDKRASSFEDQATKPIQDHVEMGYSGENGDPSFDDLIEKMNGIDYYPVLFKFVYGDSTITEERVQKAIAQFVRSIQSFDSKFDEGRAQATNDLAAFPNFSDQENLGKSLFNTHPPLGGAGCVRCHNGSEFSLINFSQNNGIIGVAGDTSAIDLIVTRAPSLRDLVNANGESNGPFMHDGSLETLMDVVNHYDHMEDNPLNTNLDFRLAGAMHQLDLSQAEKEAIVAFLHTLSGVEIYTGERWSDPFDENGNITVVPVGASSTNNGLNPFEVKLFPNPTTDKISISLKEGTYQFVLYDASGKKVKAAVIHGNYQEDLSQLSNGLYVVQLIDLGSRETYSTQVVKK